MAVYLYYNTDDTSQCFSINEGSLTHLTQKTFYNAVKANNLNIKNTDIWKINNDSDASGHSTNFITFPNCKELEVSGTITNNAFSGLNSVKTLSLGTGSISTHSLNDLESLRHLILPSRLTINSEGIVNAPYITKVTVLGNSYEKNCLITGKRNIRCINLSSSTITISNAKLYFTMLADTGVFIISQESQYTDGCLDGNWYAILSSDIKTLNQSNGTFSVFLYNSENVHRNVNIPEYENYYINSDTGEKQIVFINELWHILNESYIGELLNNDTSRQSIKFIKEDDNTSNSYTLSDLSPLNYSLTDDLYVKATITISNLNSVENSIMYYSLFKAIMDNNVFSCINSEENAIQFSFSLNNSDLNTFKSIISNGLKIYELLKKDVYATGISINEKDTEYGNYRYKEYHTTLYNVDFMLKKTPVAELVYASNTKPKDYAESTVNINRYYPISYSYWEYYDGTIDVSAMVPRPSAETEGIVKALDTSLNYYNNSEKVLYEYSDGTYITEILQDALMTGYYSFNDVKKIYYIYKYSDDIDITCYCNKLYACYYLYKSLIEESQFTETTYNIPATMTKTSLFKYTFNNQDTLSIKSFDVDNNKIYFYNNKSSIIAPLNATNVKHKMFEIRYDGIYRSCLGYTMNCEEYPFLQFDYVPNKDTNYAYIKNEDLSTNSIITNKYNYNYKSPIKYAYLYKTVNNSIIDSSAIAKNIYASYTQCDNCYPTISLTVSFFNDYMFPTNDTVYVYDIYSCNNESHKYTGNKYLFDSVQTTTIISTDEGNDLTNFVSITGDYMSSIILSGYLNDNITVTGGTKLINNDVKATSERRIYVYCSYGWLVTPTVSDNQGHRNITLTFDNSKHQYYFTIGELTLSSGLYNVTINHNHSGSDTLYVNILTKSINNRSYCYLLRNSSKYPEKYTFYVRYNSRNYNLISPYSYSLTVLDYGPSTLYRVVIGLDCFYIFYKNKNDKEWTMADSMTSDSSTFKANFIDNGYESSQLIKLTNNSLLMYSRILVCKGISTTLQNNYNNFKYDNINIGTKLRDVKPYVATYNGNEESKSYALFDTVLQQFIQSRYLKEEIINA